MENGASNIQNSWKWNNKRKNPLFQIKFIKLLAYAHNIHKIRDTGREKLSMAISFLKNTKYIINGRTQYKRWQLA